MLGACSEVRVYGAEEVRIHRFVGFTKIDVASAGKPVFVDTAGAGLIAGDNHLTVGWMHEQLAVFPDPSRCAVLIVAKTADDVKAVERVLSASGQTLNNICIAGRKHEETAK